MGQNLQQTVSQNIGKITTISGVGKKNATSQQHVALPERCSASPCSTNGAFFFQNPVFVSPPAKLSGLKMVPFMI